MNNKTISKIKTISLILMFLICVQILLGAWVRLTGSGMSCPDWPLCYGMILPLPSKVMALENIQYTYFQVFLEWIHRANAAFLIGPFSLFLALIIFFNKKLISGSVKLAYILLFLLFIQGLLGGLTVFKSNIPWSVAIHLVFAFLLFFTVINIYLSTFSNYKVLSISKFTKVNIFISGLLVMITGAAGAFTSKSGASLACKNWPGCNQSFFPNLNDNFELIHFSHRVLALFFIISIFILIWFLFKKYKEMSAIYKKAFLLVPATMILQIFVGGLLIYFDVPIWMGIFHQGTGLLLFSLISIMFYYSKSKQ